MKQAEYLELSEVKPTVTISGTVCSGVREASFFVDLPWVQAQCLELLGFQPYPGTLNVKVNCSQDERWRVLKDSGGLLLRTPTTEFCNARLFPGKLLNCTIAVVVPLTNYPSDTLEILAAERLREKLGLIDGESVTVFLYTNFRRN